MTHRIRRARLCRVAALGALTLMVTSTLAASPATAGPLEDFLAGIGTGSAAPGSPTSPPTTVEPFIFTINSGYGRQTTRVVQSVNQCVTITGTQNGQPITGGTRLEPRTVSYWTATLDPAPECNSRFSVSTLLLRQNSYDVAIAVSLEQAGLTARCDSPGCGGSGRSHFYVG